MRAMSVWNRCSSSVIFGDNLDQTNNVAIEFGKVFGGDPVFLMNRTADGLSFVARQKIRLDRKTGDVTATLPALGVPVARDLGCVLFVKHGIEDWLFGQSRWKYVVTASLDQVQFFLPNRA